MRQLAIVGGLATQACAPLQLRFHLGISRRLAIRTPTVVAVFELVQIHAGIAAAETALVAPKAVLSAGEDTTEPDYR